MDLADTDGGALGGFEDGGEKPRTLPADLPKSLDDRRRPTELVPETEMYDGWQGPSLNQKPVSFFLPRN